MATYIAFLRGINVGGHHKILMKQLTNVLENNHFKNVKTYIQSGNVVFTYNNSSCTDLEIVLSKLILQAFGHNITVLVRTLQDLKTIIEDFPLSKEVIEQSYFLMLKNKPLEQDLEKLNSISYPNEVFKYCNTKVYLYCSNGYGKTKLTSNFFEKQLKVAITARNYKTINKVLQLAEAI